jgi:RHS repeat-associated protein
MEKDDELKGEGNSYDFGARIYDPRIGRWFAPDPMERKSPDWTPYRFCYNNPLRWVDKDGKYETDGHYWTVYMVGLMVGLDNIEAEKLARLAEQPDTTIHKNIASEQNYTWSDAALKKQCIHF